MGKTTKGIYYPDNYDAVADIPADMKELAESIDTIVTEEENNIKGNKKDIETLQVENENLKAENTRIKEDLKNAIPKGQASGESIDIEDSAEMRFPEFKIRGNSKQETRILPDGYTQVDYIESTSYAYNYNYINTGIFPTNNTSIEMSVNIPSDITHSYDRLFGSGALLSVHLDGSNQNKARVLWNKTLSSDYSLINVPFGVKNIIKQDKNVTYLNGEKILEFSNGNFEDDKELRLFSSLEDSGDRDGILKLYYCKIWENDILKRNFIPCYRNSDNEIGLYDTVNDVFYTNQGTGTFIKGNDSSLPSPNYPSEVESCGDNVNFLEFGTGITSNGITNTLEKDGGFKSTGTATDTWFNINDSVNKNIEAGTYTISKTTKEYAISLKVVYTDNTSKTFAIEKNNLYKVINIEKQVISYRFWAWDITNGTSLNVTNYMKLEPGSTASPYSKYGQGCINEVICNDNLFKSTFDWSPIGSNGELSQTQGCHSGFIKVTPNKDYTIFNKVGLDGVYYFISYYDKDKKWIKNSGNYWYTNKISFTTSNITEYIRVSYLYVAPDVVNQTFKIQLNIGNTARTYIEHKSQTITIPTQQPFRAIGEYKDTFVKEEGRWFERHYIYRAIFNGTEYWQKTINDNGICYWATYDVLGIPFGNAQKKLCNYFKYESKTWKEANPNIIAENSLTDPSSYSILFCVDYANTLDEWKSWIAEKYNAGKPLYVDYILAEPLDIECTEEQNAILDQIEKEAKSYKGGTHIYSTDKISANVDVTYFKDLEILLGNGV